MIMYIFITDLFRSIDPIECGASVTMKVGWHPMFADDTESTPRTPWVKKLSVLFLLNEIAEEYACRQ